jgi:hypothetical protein
MRKSLMKRPLVAQRLLTKFSFFLLPLVFFPAFSSAQNLVVNPGFEKGSEGWRWINSRNARASGKVDTATAHTGRASYRITNASKVSPYVYCEIYQEVKVKPNTPYQISAWCKGLGASWVRLQGDYKWTFTRAAPEGDFDWVRLSGTHTTGPEQTVLPVMLHVESVTQAVWVDDVEVYEVSSAAKAPLFYIRSNREKLLDSDRMTVAREQKNQDKSPWIRFRDKEDKKFGADVRTAWNEKGLILDVRVKDLSPGPAGIGPEMFALDCVQIGIETNPGSSQTTSGYAATSFELGFSLLDSGKVDQFAWQPGNFSFEGVIAKGTRTDDGYDLNIFFPWENLRVTSAIPEWIALNVLVNEGKNGRRWVAWTPGIGVGKNPNEFARVALMDREKKSDSVGRVVFDQPVEKIYDHEEEIVGRYLEYAIAPLPQTTVALLAKGTDGKTYQLGKLQLPSAAAGEIRQVDFIIPSALIDQEGTYAFLADSRNQSPVKPIVRTNIKTRVATKKTTVTARIAELERRLTAKPQWKKDAYAAMGLPLAKWFFAQVNAGGFDGKQGLDWDTMQLEEIEWVLDQTDQRLARLESGQAAVYEKVDIQPGTQYPKEGVFWGKPAGKKGEDRPFFLSGYGAWDKVMNDVDLLHRTGMNLVQQEVWPKFMKQDGTMEFVGVPSASGPLLSTKILDTFAEQNVLVDYLLASHVMPDWIGAQYPEMYKDVQTRGFITYNVNHPEARKFLARWIEAVVSEIRKKPALLSMCLTNEPGYAGSGRDPYSRPAWIAFLKKQHGDLQTLNTLYAAQYANFEQVPVPPILAGIADLPKNIPGMRTYYDWITFNNQNYAAFHGWMRGQIKRVAPEILTHAKIMPIIFDRGTVFNGIDPELITNALDLAGNDSFGKWMWTPGGEYAFHWQEEMAWYDLLHSFGGKPVLNSENHLIDTDLPPVHIPVGYTQTEIWQCALHHLWNSVIWVWEVFPPNEAATIYRRPANAYAAGRAMLDLNRLADQALTITNQPASVAILYSMESIFWQDDSAATIAPLYVAVNFLGQPVTFVSEKQLAEGKIPEHVKWILLPHTTHVKNSTVTALNDFLTKGRHIIRVGSDCLAWDEYHRKHKLPVAIDQTPKISLPATDRQLSSAIKPILEKGGFKTTPLLIANTTIPAWGVEYRTVAYRGKTLVPMVNYLNKPLSVNLNLKGTAVDLLSGDPANLSAIELEPMTPRLLEIQSHSTKE